MMKINEIIKEADLVPAHDETEPTGMVSNFAILNGYVRNQSTQRKKNKPLRKAKQRK